VRGCERRHLQGEYKSIAELMHPSSLPASFLYIPIRYRFYL
jgi:hypothetical protein